MSLLWFAPAAFAGLFLLAGPILLHLLTRREQRTVPFPTLRFLSASTRVARSRRIIQDWPLLVVRIAVLAAAVLAVAAPLFLTPWRQNQWAARIARAYVLLPGAELPQGSAVYSSATFRAGQWAGDALAAATSWLADQPPARREVVVLGQPRRGQLTSADLDAVPPHVGVSFEPSRAAPVDSRITAPMLTSAAGELQMGQVNVTAEPDATAVEWQRRLAAADGLALSVRAVPAEQADAEDALRTVLRGGIVGDPDEPRRVVVAWRGADLADLLPEGHDLARTAPVAETLPVWVERLARAVPHSVRWRNGNALVQVDGSVTTRAAIGLLDTVASAMSADALHDHEPLLVSERDLEAWSRPPVAADPAARPENEGDARWLWAAALVLLALEHLLRGHQRVNDGLSGESAVPRGPAPEVTGTPANEVRVA